MNFQPITFSKRFPPITCSLFVVHEPAEPAGSKSSLPFIEYDPAKEMPNVRAAQHRGTAAAIILPDGRYWIGVTLCSPQYQFVKAVGRAKAIGRAFQSFHLKAAGELTIIESPGDAPVIGRTSLLVDHLRAAIDEMKREKGIL